MNGYGKWWTSGISSVTSQKKQALREMLTSKPPRCGRNGGSSSGILWHRESAEAEIDNPVARKKKTRCTIVHGTITCPTVTHGSECWPWTRRTKYEWAEWKDKWWVVFRHKKTSRPHNKWDDQDGYGACSNRRHAAQKNTIGCFEEVMRSYKNHNTSSSELVVKETRPRGRPK